MKVSLIIDEGSSIKSFLKLSMQKGLVFFEYADETNHSIIRESINQFRTIQLSEDDPMRITIHGPLVDRSVHFETSEDYAYFLRFIQAHNFLIPTENDPRTFTIKDKSSKKQSGLTDFVNSIVNNNQNNDQIIRRSVDGFAFKYVESLLPSLKLNTLTKEEAQTIDFSKISLSTLQIPENVFPILVTRLINPPDITEEYSNLKKQWELTSKDQWNQFLKMRVFVNSVEQYIEKSELTTEFHKQLFFNMALTLFTRYFSKLNCSPELLFSINIIIQCFLTEYADSNGFLTTSNETICFEKAELLIFSHLCQFWEKLSSNSLSVNAESASVRNTLSKISPSTLAMLDDRKLTLLDFVMADANLFFTNGRNLNDSLLLFVSALSTENISIFRKNMICASLILLQEKLQLIPFNDLKSFAETYQVELRFINTRLLILNNSMLCKSLKNE